MQDSKLDRYEIFVITALIAAQAEYGHLGFRNRDVLFLISLFSNWVETSIDCEVLPVQNSQLMRYLKYLCENSFAKKLSKKQYPRYVLTRVGFMELVGRLLNKHYVSQPSWFFFVYYFLDSYKERVLNMIKQESQLFSKALLIECEELFDTKRFLDNEIYYVKKELSKMEIRINDSLFTAKTVKRFLSEKKSLSHAVDYVAKEAPFNLASQKSLADLVSELPEDLREWELMSGNERRAKMIFGPIYNSLKNYLLELEKL